MSSPGASSPFRRWLRRFLLGLGVLILLFLGSFWLNLSANEPLISLPTFQATAPTWQPTGETTAVAAGLPAPRVTLTPIPTVTDSPVPGATRAAPTAPPEDSAATPTSLPQPTVAIAVFEPAFPTQVPAATPVAPIEMPDGITNVLLLGSDALSKGDADGSERTDSIIVISINREQGTASMLSIPRDLYLYIPGWQNSRINTAYARGNSVDYPGGGVQTLKDTIFYNFGIPIHYYAKIDFQGFEKIVDAVGGIEIVNGCKLEDWRLKAPGLDIEVEENYEMVLLEPGVHEMDGFTALWYARSRRTTSDFDRGRRQQQILQALFNKGLDLNLIGQIPQLWAALQEMVETDMDLGKLLQLAATAPSVQENGVQHLYLTQGEIESTTIPETGAQVQILIPEEARKTFERLYTIPAINRSSKNPIYVEIINRSGRPDMEAIAAENLKWFGFRPVINEESLSPVPGTTLAYHRTNLKGSYNWLVSWIFGLPAGSIALEPENQTPYQYTAVLGEDYRPCRNPLYAPRP